MTSKFTMIVIISLFVIIFCLYFHSRPINKTPIKTPTKTPIKTPTKTPITTPTKTPITPPIIPPVVEHAEITRLRNLVFDYTQNPSHWDVLLAIAGIYQTGLYPTYLPNEDMACEIYKYASRCPDGKIAGLAQAKFMETRMKPINLMDRGGQHLPAKYAIQVCNVADAHINSLPSSAFEKPIGKEPEPQRRFVAPAHDHNANRVDFQNVHDHGVTTITKRNVQALQAHVNPNTPYERVIQDVKGCIARQSSVSNREKEDALRTLESLSTNTHSTYNVSEQEALAGVWEKIQKSHPNQKETLVKQLASAVENGHVVCSSGKIARIIATFDGVTNESVKPLWALREELNNTAAKMREDYPNMSDQSLVDMFKRQAVSEYVFKLGFTESIITPIIDEISTGFL
jgi:hypothetical protein